MKKFIYKLINRYATNFRFPPKGFSIFYAFCKLIHIDQFPFSKKLSSNIVLSLYLHDHIQRQLFWHGSYELDELRLLLMFLQKGDSFIDIGANIGYYALHAAQITEDTGTVWAFEPATSIYNHLMLHIRLNKSENIKTIQKGLSDKKGSAILYLSGNSNCGSTGLKPGDEFEGITERVDLITLDEFVYEQDIKNITSIKIDVEGHEMQVLEGMQQTLQKYAPVVLLEMITSQLQSHNARPSDIYTWMDKSGYRAFYINRHKKLSAVPSLDFEAYGIFFLQKHHHSKPFRKEIFDEKNPEW